MSTRGSKREVKAPARLINEEVKPAAKKVVAKKAAKATTAKKAPKKATTTAKKTGKTTSKTTTAKKAKDSKAVKAKTEAKKVVKKTPVAKKPAKKVEAKTEKKAAKPKTVAPKPAKTASPKKVASPKTKKTKTPSAYDLLSQVQREELDVLTINQLKDRLRANDQLLSGSRPELVKRVSDCIIHGCLPRCPTCSGGRLKYEGGVYKCPGYHDDDNFVSCHYRSTSVTRPAWQFSSETGKVI
eukprot:TRINITY_DN5776_c0_g2_i1.p1 TRINITY_DN5776_c0_g2~~TRINITY_DN5776_c0_g2_i1.p1  ORF type:complete len:241 (-),score=49.11 TRINITY_DN5776_c0_g2_i1:188-910(-)